MSTRIWITDEIELRVRKKGDPTPWAKIPLTVLNNLPPQAPKRPWSRVDSIERRRPATPAITPAKKTTEHKASNQTEFSNIYDILEDNSQE